MRGRIGTPQEKEPGYIEIDSIVKFVDGIKVYIINAIDVKTRFVFSKAYTYVRSPKINGYREIQ